MTSQRSPIIFALDFASADEASRAADGVKSAVGMVKVGLELFVEAGPKACAIGAEVGLPVFLDLKLHDIPETVERAVGRASALGAKILTVHASGGPAMLERAAKRAQADGAGLQIAAVTVLTSLDDADLARIGYGAKVEEQARRLARMAFDCGVRAFVCSPKEARAMRAELGKDATLITPGVRATSAADAAMKHEDQKRVATASQAIADGADWLVVGRPIRDAKDPLAAARALTAEALAAKVRRT